jgi:NAD(P)-dependent dehydrogenase (short-subunit alcohol dehydrogenase family)
MTAGISIDLTAKRVLVVGASSGVGRAVAALAARSGARVGVAARRADKLGELAEELGREGAEVHVSPGDVSVEADCRSLVDTAVASLGGLDALVYAPGISPLRLLAEASQEEWQRVFAVNVIGASLVTAEALAPLKESGGRVVVVGSYAVRQTLPGIGLYSVSKVALDGLLAAWRMEHPDVDFTRVVLGNTLGTEFAQDWGPERTAEITKLWIDRGLFPSATMMPLAAAAEAIVSVLAVQGYIDDIAVMPRSGDHAAG